MTIYGNLLVTKCSEATLQFSLHHNLKSGITTHPYLLFLTAAGNIAFLRTLIRLTTCPRHFTSTFLL